MATTYQLRNLAGGFDFIIDASSDTEELCKAHMLTADFNEGQQSVNARTSWDCATYAAGSCYFEDGALKIFVLLSNNRVSYNCPHPEAIDEMLSKTTDFAKNYNDVAYNQSERGMSIGEYAKITFGYSDFLDKPVGLFLEKLITSPFAKFGGKLFE